MNLLINVTSHEIGHATGALPQYANDQFPLNTPLNPTPAEPGTVMEQGVSAEYLGANVRDFSTRDAEKLREALNDPPSQ